MERTNLFNNLKFEQHRFSENGMCAKQTFDNKHTISIVTGDGFYGDINEHSFMDSTFEVAVFNPEGDFIKLTQYDDVIGLQTANEVNEIMNITRDDPDSLQVDEVATTDS
jgi:hypothetical protein